MARAPHSSTHATAGVSEVMGAFERIGWAPVEVKEKHDLGTDLLVAARDARRFDRGLLIGVQVKSGPSWFLDQCRDEAGNVTGWWYRENEPSHFDYWVKHQLPHLVILYDLDSRCAYWVHVTAQRCVPTGKGVKIAVPADQRIDARGVDALFEVASSQRATISLEGSAFDAAAYRLAPGARLRHALVIPRTVAPHPNKGSKAYLEPEEAIALLAQHRTQQLHHRLRDHPAWPDEMQRPQSSDWRWQFAHAMWIWLTQRRTAELDACRDSANRADWRVCASIVRACAAYEDRQCDLARQIVQDELESDTASPVDHAWLRLQHGRFSLELGDLDAARTAVTVAVHELSADADDISASFFLGLAYAAQLTLSSMDRTAEPSLATTLRATDNAATWWRNQQSFWALDAAAQEHFQLWCRDKSWRFSAEPPSQRLWADIFVASIGADTVAWQAGHTRLGRHKLITSRDMNDVQAGLMSLFCGHDDDAFLVAARRLEREGPCEALRKFSELVRPEYMTRSTSAVFVKFWSEFGRYGESVTTNAVTSWLWKLALTASDALSIPGIAQRIQRRELFGALAGVIQNVSTDLRARMAADATMVEVAGTDLDEFCQFICRAPDDFQAGLPSDWLLDLANRAKGDIAVARLLWMASRNGSSVARETLLEHTQSGDIASAAVVFGHEDLGAKAMSATVKTLTNQLARIQAEAQMKRFGLGRSIEPAEFLARLAIESGEAEAWDALVQFLCDRNVLANDKVRAIFVIAHHSQRVPHVSARNLLDGIADIEASEYLQTNPFDRHEARRAAVDLGLLLRVAFEGLTDECLAVVRRWAEHSDEARRRSALDVVSLRPRDADEAMVAGRLDDVDAEVRAAAAYAGAKMIAALRRSSALENVVRKVADDVSTSIPASFLAGLSSPLPEWTVHVVASLRGHPCRNVRDRATALLGEE